MTTRALFSAHNFAAPIPTLGVGSDQTHDAVTADDQRSLPRKVLEEETPSAVTVELNRAAEGKK